MKDNLSVRLCAQSTVLILILIVGGSFSNLVAQVDQVVDQNARSLLSTLAQKTAEESNRLILKYSVSQSGGSSVTFQRNGNKFRYDVEYLDSKGEGQTNIACFDGVNYWYYSSVRDVLVVASQRSYKEVSDKFGELMRTNPLFAPFYELAYRSGFSMPTHGSMDFGLGSSYILEGTRLVANPSMQGEFSVFSTNALVAEIKIEDQRFLKSIKTDMTGLSGKAISHTWSAVSENFNGLVIPELIEFTTDYSETLNYQIRLDSLLLGDEVDSDLESPFSLSATAASIIVDHDLDGAVIKR